MHGKIGLLSPGKASSYRGFFPLYAVFSCFHTTGSVRPALVRRMEVGSLTCAQMWVRAVYVTHEGGGGGVRHTNKSAHDLTRRDRKTVPHAASPQIEARVFGSEFRLSDSH